MSGHNAFNTMVTETTTTQVHFKNHIKSKAFEEWKKLYTFEGLRGIPYGESFCNHFDVHDYILIYCLTPAEADTYIERHYLEKI